METDSKLSIWLNIVLVLLVLPFVASSRIVSNDDENCPPWFFYNTTTNRCQCYHGDHLGNDIHCNEDGILLEVGNCMTYKRNVGTFFARCYYFQLPYGNITADGYFQLPSNVTELNDYMCGHMNRKGLVCSECIDGFGPSITSFGYKCANCSEPWQLRGVALYILVEFVPITFFYFLVLTFRINMTSAPMTCFILYSQLMVYLIFKDPVTISTLITQSHYSSVVYLVLIVGTFYGIWNLDLLKYVVPPFCINHKLSIIHIEFLNSLSALYPLILVFLTWICIELHGQNFRPLVVMWKPFHRCFVWLRKEYDTKHDIVDVFATFLLLTYSKLNYQLVQILSNQYIILNGVVHTKVNLYDPTIVYMSSKHIPYVIVSLFVLIILIIPPPFILLLYPTKAFSKVLTKLKVTGRCTIVLETFVEKFHGCYTNGLNGTKDTRSLSAIFFILRPAVILIYEIHVLHLFYHAWILAIALFVGVSLLTAYVKPYRKSYMNLLDTLLLLHIALLCLLISTSFKRNTMFITICEILLFTSPMIIFLLIFVAKFAMRIKHFLCSNNCVQHRRQCITESESSIEDNRNNSSEESQHLLLSASVNVKFKSYT